MKFNSITVGGCVPFPEKRKFYIPDSKIIAITGDNGAGKSTLLDCIYIGLYGSMTKPGSLYTLFNTSDGFVEIDLTYQDNHIVIRRLIDGVTRKQKVFVWLNDLCLTEGKVSQANEAVASVIAIPESVFLASVYNAQTQKGNPLGMKESERRQLLSSIIGLGAFYDIHEQVGTLIKEKEAEALQLRSKREGLESVIHDDIDDIELLFTEKKATQKLIDDNTSELEQLQQQLADTKASQVDINEIKQNTTRLTNLIADSKASITDKEARIKKNQSVLLAQSAEIKAASKILEEVKPKIDQLDEKIQLKESQIGHIKASFQGQQSLQVKYGNEKEALLAQKNRLESDLKEVALLDEVPCGAKGEYASCALIAKQVKIKQEAPNLITQAIEAVAQKDTQLNDVIKSMADYQDQCNAANVDLEALKEEKKLLKNIVAENEKLATYLPDLELADEKIEHYLTQISDEEQKLAINQPELERWQARLEASKNSIEAVIQAENKLNEFKRSLTLKKSDFDALTLKISNAELKKKQNAETVEKINEISEVVSGLFGKINDLNVLYQGLGPKGAIALKIDAAGPAISHLANTLLAECFGSRFTIVIKTQKELVSDASQLRECLEFSVIDNDTGVESEVEQKSGGEQQLIREVISLALCIYQRKQTGADLQTVVRDEACSALTEANTEKYIKMLSKACEIGEFKQVLFVSHKSLGQLMADDCIQL